VSLSCPPPPISLLDDSASVAASFMSNSFFCKRNQELNPGSSGLWFGRLAPKDMRGINVEQHKCG
jgi:hypothetical protein